MSNYSTDQWARGLALFLGIFFIPCFFWTYVLQDPALRALHIDLLRMSFLGFAGMDIMSFVLGLIQSLIWGYVLGWVLAWSLNYCKK